MSRFERLGVLAMVIGTGAVCAVGTIYLHPAAVPSDVPAAVVAAPVMPAPIRTVTWFKAHAAERKDKNAACKDNPGVAMHDPECVNAEEAGIQLSVDRFINSVPPPK
jgi:hypothetical protein